MSCIAPAVSERYEEPSLRHSLYELLKRPLDMVLTLTGLALTFPLLALGAILVKLTSRGPMLYSQVRLGAGGRPFLIYKLRTMRHNCEALSGPCWSSHGDSRITWIGRILRRTHVDELPQLWNILIGDMSLIGPRPERPEMIHALEKVLPLYRQRMAIRPGLSGLAQIQLPPDTDLNSVRIKLAHDLCYLGRISLWLDMRIILATLLNLLALPSKATRYWLALPGGKAVEQWYEQTTGAVCEVVPELQAV